MPCEHVNQMWLDAAYAVHTASFTLEVHRGARPGAPNASPCCSSHRYIFSSLICVCRLSKVGKQKDSTRGIHKAPIALDAHMLEMDARSFRLQPWPCLAVSQFEETIPQGLSPSVYGLLRHDYSRALSKPGLCNQF